MLVTVEKIEVFRIGESMFVTDEEGYLRNIKTGERPTTDEEWNACMKQICRMQDEENARAEYEKEMEEEEKRHEECIMRIKSRYNKKMCKIAGWDYTNPLALENKEFEE